MKFVRVATHHLGFTKILVLESWDSFLDTKLPSQWKSNSNDTKTFTRVGSIAARGATEIGSGLCGFNV